MQSYTTQDVQRKLHALLHKPMPSMDELNERARLTAVLQNPLLAAALDHRHAHRTTTMWEWAVNAKIPVVDVNKGPALQTLRKLYQLSHGDDQTVERVACTSGLVQAAWLISASRAYVVPLLGPRAERGEIVYTPHVGDALEWMARVLDDKDPELPVADIEHVHATYTDGVLACGVYHRARRPTPHTTKVPASVWDRPTLQPSYYEPNDN